MIVNSVCGSRSDSEKQDPDPDPNQSKKAEALKGHFGALEGPNLVKVSGRIRIRIRIKVKRRKP
jgi:hypothetical protein